MTTRTVHPSALVSAHLYSAADHSASFRIADATFYAVETQSYVVWRDLHLYCWQGLHKRLLLPSVLSPIISSLSELRPEILNGVVEEIPPLRNHIIHLVVPQLWIRSPNRLDNPLVRDLIGPQRLFNPRARIFDLDGPRTA